MPAGTTRAFRSPWTFGCMACGIESVHRCALIGGSCCGHDQGFPTHLAQSSLFSLSLATPAVSIVALLRCRLHRSVSTASSARLIAATGGSLATEPVSPGSSPDGSIGALLRYRLHRLFHRFLRLTSSATGGVRLRNLASSLHLAQSAR